MTQSRTTRWMLYLIWMRASFFFFNDTATTEIYTLSLHDALPISDVESRGAGDALELVLLDAGLEQALAPALLVSPRPEGADVERLGAERALERRDVELVVVRQHYDGGLVV